MYPCVVSLITGTAVWLMILSELLSTHRLEDFTNHERTVKHRTGDRQKQKWYGYRSGAGAVTVDSCRAGADASGNSRRSVAMYEPPSRNRQVRKEKTEGTGRTHAANMLDT